MSALRGAVCDCTETGDLISETLSLPHGELRLLRPRDGAELPDDGGVSA